MTAFLLTWKESGWPHENIVRMCDLLEKQGYVDEPWRIAAYKMSNLGDRVFVLRQGRGPKGIFGAGHISGMPSLGPVGDGKSQMMVPVRFEAFVNPKERMLIDDPAVAAILRPNQIRAMGSGYPIDDDQAEALDNLLATTKPVELGGVGDWTELELRAIVGDYFVMLAEELAGNSYSKTTHRDVLRKTVRRSPGSIERKHQNISAIMQELGLPWIEGYKPLKNFQDALVDCVEAKLDNNIHHFEHLPPPVEEPPSDVSAVFVPPPPAATPPKGRSITRVSGKYDPAARDADNRALGKAGEDYIIKLEQNRLIGLGREDLAGKVKWVADQCHLGYDIQSFSVEGEPLFVEVKTTRGSISTPFFLSENERRMAAAYGQRFCLYRLFNFGIDPKVYSLPGPLEAELLLEPIAYRVRVGRP